VDPLRGLEFLFRKGLMEKRFLKYFYKKFQIPKAQTLEFGIFSDSYRDWNLRYL